MAHDLETKEEIKVKLEDIANSQQSLIEKVGVIQVELLNHPDKVLERELNELNKRLSASFDYIHTVIEHYNAGE